MNVRAAIIAAQIRARYPSLKLLRIPKNQLTNWTYMALCEGGWMKAWEEGTWALALQVSFYLEDLCDQAQTHGSRPPAPPGAGSLGVVAPGE